MRYWLPSVCIFLLFWSTGCATFSGEGQSGKNTVDLRDEASRDIDKSARDNLYQSGGSNDFHLSVFETAKFYETQIDYKTRAGYEYLVREKIKPLVKELEEEGLIQGFHFIMHGTLDLRLEVVDENKLSIIADKISATDILFSDLKLWNGFTENSQEYQWYGPEGIAISLQSLESNSRLLMKLFQFKENAENLPLGEEKTIDNLNHQMVHYFLIQQGIDNRQQVNFSLDDAKFWMDKVYKPPLPFAPQKHRRNSLMENQVVDTLNSIAMGNYIIGPGI